MNILEFQKIDSTFNESMFITKVNNIFKKLLTSIMLEKTKEIKHFLSEDLYNSVERKVLDLSGQNRRQMYDELNINNTKITDIEDIGDRYKITVTTEVKYLDYIIDKTNQSILSGDTQNRIKESYTLEFTKLKSARVQGIVRKCQSCGASMDVNSTGICKFCGSTYDQESHDWILTKVEKY